MKLRKNPLFWIAWLAPLLLFPISPGGSYSVGGASYIIKGDGYTGSRSYFFSAYGPIWTPIAFGDYAQLFLPTQDRQSYFMNPHWRYWLYWAGGAVMLTLYLQSQSKKS